MLIGNENISIEDMPSYVSPSQQPYHLFQSMQDILQQALQRNNAMMVMPNSPGNMSNKSNQWDGDGK